MPGSATKGTYSARFGCGLPIGRRSGPHLRSSAGAVYRPDGDSRPKICGISALRGRKGPIGCQSASGNGVSGCRGSYPCQVGAKRRHRCYRARPLSMNPSEEGCRKAVEWEIRAGTVSSPTEIIWTSCAGGLETSRPCWQCDDCRWMTIGI